MSKTNQKNSKELFDALCTYIYEIEKRTIELKNEKGDR